MLTVRHALYRAYQVFDILYMLNRPAADKLPQQSLRDIVVPHTARGDIARLCGLFRGSSLRKHRTKYPS